LSEKDSQGNLLATWCEPDLIDPYKAFCLVYNKRFSCSNSGNAQIIAHAKGAKHIVLQKKGQKVLGVVQCSKSCASSSTSTSKIKLQFELQIFMNMMHTKLNREFIE